MAHVDPTTVRWLASPEGHESLHGLPEYREADAVGLASRLRAAGHSAERVAALLTQKRLQARAQSPVGAAGPGRSAVTLMWGPPSPWASRPVPPLP